MEDNEGGEGFESELDSQLGDTKGVEQKEEMEECMKQAGRLGR